MNFILISVIAYIFNGFATIIDKILINKSIPSAFVYTFYISVLGALVVVLVPFGVQFDYLSIIFGSISGIFSTLGLLTYFQALRTGEASIVAPIVGGLSPLFTLLIGGIFLNQILSPIQLAAFFLLILGTVVLTANLWSKRLQINHQLLLMILSGLFFGLSYLFLRETFLVSNFFTGMVLSRLAGLGFALLFLLSPKIRQQLVSNKASHHDFINKTSLLLLFGQGFGALSGILINFAITLANPALVNSLFGFQYLVILIAALILAKEHRAKLLEEDLSRRALIEKVVGAGILSIGVYLLSK